MFKVNCLKRGSVEINSNLLVILQTLVYRRSDNGVVLHAMQALRGKGIAPTHS